MGYPSAGATRGERRPPAPLVLATCLRGVGLQPQDEERVAVAGRGAELKDLRHGRAAAKGSGGKRRLELRNAAPFRQLDGLRVSVEGSVLQRPLFLSKPGGGGHREWDFQHQKYCRRSMKQEIRTGSQSDAVQYMLPLLLISLTW